MRVRIHSQSHVQAQDEADKAVGEYYDWTRKVDPKYMELASTFLE